MEILDTASSDENRIEFSADEVAIVKEALKTKLFARSGGSVEERIPKFAALVKNLSEKFGIPELHFECVRGNNEIGYGFLNPETNTIVTNERLSLTTTLFVFGIALKHHKPDSQELRTPMEGGHYNPWAFALSMFKQAAPRMFEEAKNNGRLMGTNVPYTDGGRLPVHGSADAGDDPEETPEPEQEADIDPENRVDRGNGIGED